MPYDCMLDLVLDSDILFPISFVRFAVCVGGGGATPLGSSYVRAYVPYVAINA